MSPEFANSQRSRITGFTLIEMLVVVFIISILVAATLTIVPKVRRAVQGAQTQAQLATLANAIQQYYNDYKSYPGPLGNNQLCAGDDAVSIQVPPTAGGSALTATNVLSFPNQNNNPGTATFQSYYITGSQNLVLGLLGGLEMVSNGGTGYNFNYNAQDIFSDGSTPAPRGPASLNTANPRRQQAYIQVKAGDLSIPSTTFNGGKGASFVDASGDLIAADLRSPADAMIPVFLDKYSDPLPILYYRTNVGATAIVGFRNMVAFQSTTQLQDPGNPNVGLSAFNVTAQYDILQNLPYVASKIGTIGMTNFHGLQGITSNSAMLLITQSPPPSPNPDAIDNYINSQYLPSNNGANALAYFKDPSLNNAMYDGTTSNMHMGIARQKDGFILISAGPDRLYGTHDDNIYPGPLLPGN